MQRGMWLWAVMCVAGLMGYSEVPEDAVVVKFDAQGLPPNMQQNQVQAEVITFQDKPALNVDYQVADWPNVFFRAPEGGWNWSPYGGLAVDLYNPTDVDIDVSVRVDNEGADGIKACNTSSLQIRAKSSATLECRFRTAEYDTFWGMRGVPERGPVPQGSIIDTSRIVAFQVYLPLPREPHTLIIQQVRLFGKGGPLKDEVALPFVDAFGQYKHADWPGKLHNAEEFAQRIQAEEDALSGQPDRPGRDAYGGWAEGPQREATGWFRTEQIDGVWWLVTPEGHLFFSTGIDCVGTYERTFITGRDGWFEGLPDRADPVWAGFFGEQSGVHSMAEPIGGKGMTFGFYSANLFRKYGAEWPDRWRDTAYRRLRHWGFNTIANWSQEDVLKNSTLPFVVSSGIWGKVREIEGASGYWGRMKDVYDPQFAECVDASIAGVKRFADNPLCIGYFVDNELGWETIREGVLASPVDQPARIAFIEQLKTKYGTFEALNAAWNCEATGWDTLRVPAKRTMACTHDLDELEYSFALLYFDTIKAALAKHAPHQLYLGCRFSTTPAMAVRACADVADVIGFNRYVRQIVCDDEYRVLRKPIIIGEFHFGALDRGMFHTGLVAAQDQADRGRCYAEYVRAAAACPACVGTHWFQWVDEPLTGRFYDGENYNIGFVSITDTPYPELVKAAQGVHDEIYAVRGGASY